jgi:hypothetical protein
MTTLLTRAALMLAAATLCGAAAALPSAENAGFLVDVQSVKKGSPIYLIDHEDPKKAYVPFDRIYLVDIDENDERPQFGLTYDENGGKLGMTVRAGYSVAAARLVEQLRADDFQVGPLMPSSGSWTLAMATPSGLTNTIGIAQKLDTVLPTSPVAIEIMLPRETIAYVVHAFRTGFGVGVNYLYNFRAVRQSFTFKASVNWTRVRSYIKEQNIVAEGGCTKVDANGGISFLAVAASYKSCFTDTSNVRKIVQALVTRQDIKLFYTGPTDNDRVNKMIDEVTKLVLHMNFKSELKDSERLPDEAVPNAECDVSEKAPSRGVPNLPPPAGLSVFVGHCSKKAHRYVYDSELIYENAEYSYLIQTSDIMTFPGAVGGGFGELCVRYPTFFIKVNAPQGEQFGCPTQWNTTTGVIQNPSNGGPQPVLPPPTSPAFIPPMLPIAGGLTP